MRERPSSISPAAPGFMALIKTFHVTKGYRMIAKLLNLKVLELQKKRVENTNVYTVIK